MLNLYGSDLSGPAIKVRLLASYLGVDYQWKIVNLKDKEQKQEWFLKMNPVGKIPVMDDGGFYLFESNTICKYLADKYESRLYPKPLQERAIVDQWIDFVSFHVSVHVSTIVFNRVFAPRTGRPVNEAAVTDAANFLAMYFPIVEAQLAKHAFIVAQNMTLADIVLFSMLEPADIAQISLAEYPKLSAWRQNLKQQPFYTKCYKEYGEMLKKN